VDALCPAVEPLLLVLVEELLKWLAADGAAGLLRVLRLQRLRLCLRVRGSLQCRQCQEAAGMVSSEAGVTLCVMVREQGILQYAQVDEVWLVEVTVS
jgi:hypothetical protein